MAWFPKQKIVVPVDFSDESLAAVDVALELAAAPHGVHVVHVLHELSSVEPNEVWLIVDHETRCQHTTAAIRDRLVGEKYQPVNIHVAVGDPGHEIAEYAREIGADLIVMPSHGRSGITRWLLGSVAERTLRLAHCPVLVLRV